jgi:hypothetical protein
VGQGSAGSTGVRVGQGWGSGQGNTGSCSSGTCTARSARGLSSAEDDTLGPWLYCQAIPSLAVLLQDGGRPPHSTGLALQLWL